MLTGPVLYYIRGENDPGYLLSSRSSALTVELCVAEIEANVDGDHGEVKDIEEKSQKEDEAHSSTGSLGHGCLEDLAYYAAGVAHKDEYLEKEALSF